MSKLRAFAVLALALALPASLIVPDIAGAETVSIASVTPTSPWALLKHEAPAGKASGELSLPAQASGPVPALVLKHGSGGGGRPPRRKHRETGPGRKRWGVAPLILHTLPPPPPVPPR